MEGQIRGSSVGSMRHVNACASKRLTRAKSGLESRGGTKSELRLTEGPGSRGHPVLMYNGFRYNLDYRSGARSCWRCNKRRSRNCKATLITFNDEIVRRAVLTQLVGASAWCQKLLVTILNTGESTDEFLSPVEVTHTLCASKNCYISKSKRGKSVLNYRGFRYHETFSSGYKTWWRCSKRQSNCKASLTTMNAEIIRYNANHNHTNDNGVYF
ncbi:hypothetical protein EVAR_17920_1 [Eumeta japonica]|uniref:FLYWCH-type domain-containing protein n=1 Tax=Eumeta variegata TaxID=151549 RepID=A0A4C1UY61_EUMVA|nr:hypothetical protein EVAR_17920_1 [Eumeta japonica]